jgi:hypothetical protein
LCVFLSFLLLEKKKMPKRRRLKQKGRNKRPEAKAKSERAKQKLEIKLPPFFTFFFLLYGFFSLFFCLRKRRCQEKMLETEGQKREGRSRSQK